MQTSKALFVIAVSLAGVSVGIAETKPRTIKPRGVFRSHFTMAAIDECGNKEIVNSPEIGKAQIKNPLVDTVSLPTDGKNCPVVPSSSAVAIEREVKYIELFDPVAPEPLPANLLEPDKEGLILATDVKPDDSMNETLNPFDPRGIRPLGVAETKFRVGAIMVGVRPVAVINGTLTQKGGSILGYTITRIEPTFVILTHSGKFFKLPPSRNITIRTPKTNG